MFDDKAFWVVWQPEGGAPRVRHADEATARGEAERLARIHPGLRFFVLKAAEYYCRDEVRRVVLAQSDWISNEEERTHAGE